MKESGHIEIELEQNPERPNDIARTEAIMSDKEKKLNRREALLRVAGLGLIPAATTIAASACIYEDYQDYGDYYNTYTNYYVTYTNYYY